nr:hypothetical protein HK105_005871 [Polyrhizophydium stewartii]
MNIDSFFKAPGAASAGRLKRQQALGSLSAAKRSREDELTIRETTDEEFRASWGVGSSTAKRTGPDGRVGGRDAGGSAADDVGEPRLHGSGASAERQRIMDIVDAGEDMPEGVDLQSLKRMLLRFEKVLTKNQDLRSKYADQPLKYLDSETDLAEEIKALTTLSSVPELYPTLIDLSSHASILALLSHENTDITIAAIALLDELTDEDLVAETTGDAAEGVAALVAALVEKDALPLLVSNLGRLNEDKPDEKQGIFNTLSVIENFLSIDPTLAERIVDSTSIIPWILGRIAVKGFDSVRQYASELLAILLQTSRANRARVHDLDGVDTLLRVLASYRRKDPKDADETEFMENVFDALCLCLAEPPAKTKFVDAEGLELMLMMIK